MQLAVKRLGLGLILGTQVLLFQNCSNTKFTQDAGSFMTEKSCTTTLVDTARTVKILLLVDASGSNGPNQDDPAGTDPNKMWRASAINSLVNRYGTKNNFYFGLATFQGLAAKAQIKNANDQAIFSNSQAVVQSGIANFMNNKDADSTPYKAAISLAKDAIQRDLAANPGQNAVYSVVLVSDGMPSDYKNSNDVIPDASAIVSVAPSQVRLNSVFYYNLPSQRDAIDTSYLKNIAVIGKGSFVIANSNESIQLDDMLRVPVENCQ